jgi:hypothetical protein
VIRILTISAALVLAAPALALNGAPPGFPEYDSAAACEKLAAKFGDLTAGVCARDENEARDAAWHPWSDLPSDVQDHCLNVVELSAPAHMKYQSLYLCVKDMDYAQYQYAGEIPLSIRKKWLDADIRALKVGHY